MADTLQNVRLVKDVPLDLYDATGIDPSLSISVQNIGSAVVELYSGATAPSHGTTGKRLMLPYEIWVNDAGDSGAWALSVGNNGIINIEVS